MMSKIKGSLKSLTVWFNALCLAAMPLLGMLLEALPSMQAYLTQDNMRTVGILVIIVNILLRFKTTKPLEEK